MISKERLEELIEKGATIYGVEDSDIIEINCNDIQHPKNFNKDIELEQLVVCYEDTNNSLNVFEIKDENVFETKEEAEWYLEFGNITRIETLNLPTWEEFKECDTHTKFYSQKIRYTIYVYVKNKNTNNCRIMIFADDGSQDWFVFEKPLTKENYIKACEVAKKLFLGEER